MNLTALMVSLQLRGLFGSEIFSFSQGGTEFQILGTAIIACVQFWGRGQGQAFKVVCSSMPMAPHFVVGVEQLVNLQHLDVAYNLLLQHAQLAPLSTLHYLKKVSVKPGGLVD